MSITPFPPVPTPQINPADLPLLLDSRLFEHKLVPQLPWYALEWPDCLPQLPDFIWTTELESLYLLFEPSIWEALDADHRADFRWLYWAGNAAGLIGKNGYPAGDPIASEYLSTEEGEKEMRKYFEVSRRMHTRFERLFALHHIREDYLFIQGRRQPGVDRASLLAELPTTTPDPLLPPLPSGTLWIWPSHPPPSPDLVAVTADNAHKYRTPLFPSIASESSRASLSLPGEERLLEPTEHPVSPFLNFGYRCFRRRVQSQAP
ncbi:hypothetical protein JCM10207_003119 [Rhodosporidiobolus poonsookiae]